MTAVQLYNSDRQMKLTHQGIQQDHKGLAQRKSVFLEMEVGIPFPSGTQARFLNCSYITNSGWQIPGDTNIYAYIDIKNREDLLHMQILPLQGKGGQTSSSSAQWIGANGKAKNMKEVWATPVKMHKEDKGSIGESNLNSI